MKHFSWVTAYYIPEILVSVYKCIQICFLIFLKQRKGLGLHWVALLQTGDL